MKELKEKGKLVTDEVCILVATLRKRNKPYTRQYVSHLIKMGLPVHPERCLCGRTFNTFYQNEIQEWMKDFKVV